MAQSRDSVATPSITRTISIVIEKHAANLLVLLVCCGMIFVGLYTFDRIILPMSRANQDERDGLQQRTLVLETVANTLERATQASERTALIQKETTSQLLELTRAISAAQSRHP
jgi:hypothetical protein